MACFKKAPRAAIATATATIHDVFALLVADGKRVTARAGGVDTAAALCEANDGELVRRIRAATCTVAARNSNADGNHAAAASAAEALQLLALLFEQGDVHVLRLVRRYYPDVVDSLAALATDAVHHRVVCGAVTALGALLARRLRMKPARARKSADASTPTSGAGGKAAKLPCSGSLARAAAATMSSADAPASAVCAAVTVLLEVVNCADAQNCAVADVDGVMKPLMATATLSCSADAKCAALTAFQCLAENNADAQSALCALGVFDVVAALLRHEDAAVQRAAARTVGVLCASLASIQDAARESGVVAALVDGIPRRGAEGRLALLALTSTVVLRPTKREPKLQVNLVNQTLVGDLGAVQLTADRLCALVSLEDASREPEETAAALLMLVRGHAGNLARLAGCTSALPRIVASLGAMSQSCKLYCLQLVLALAAQPALHDAVVKSGAVGQLVQLCAVPTSPATTAHTIAITALHTLLRRHCQAVLRAFMSAGGERVIADQLAPEGCLKARSSSSSGRGSGDDGSALTAAQAKALWCMDVLLIQVRTNRSCVETLKAHARLPAMLARIAHPSFPQQYVQHAAERVLKTLFPGTATARVDGVREELLRALPLERRTARASPLKRQRTSSDGDGDGDGDTDSGSDGACCGICFGSREESGPAAFLPCFHTYHVSCINTWLRASGQDACPTCKLPVLETVHRLFMGVD